MPVLQSFGKLFYMCVFVDWVLHVQGCKLRALTPREHQALTENDRTISVVYAFGLLFSLSLRLK